MKRMTLLVGLLCTPLLTLGANVDHTVGIARGANDDNIRYIEHHQYLPDGRHHVDYYAPDMVRIAYKRLTYPSLARQPAIEQEDLARNLQISVEPQEEVIKMVRKENGEVRNMEIERSPDMVIDAGFDAYIKDAWSSLLADEASHVEFVVAGVDRTLRMKIEVTDKRDDRVDFRVSANNFFLGLFFPPIELTYSRDRKLMRYAGFSNVTIARDQRDVVITFDHYKTDAPLDTPLADWLPPAVEDALASR